MPASRVVWIGLFLALVATAGPPNAAAKDALPRLKRSAEFKYVDAADDADAAKLLPKLLKTYDSPKKCAKLLKLLRTKRAYPGRMPSSMTIDYPCSDGKSRQFTYLMPSKYSKRKPTGVLVFLHGAVRQGPPGGGAGEARMFAPAVKPLNLIVIGPSTYEGVGWDKPACRDLVFHAVTFAKTYFNVDEDRVYLAGDSDGGRGAYVTLETMAGLFAAAVPVIGAPGSVTRFANLRNVPIFAINGENDSIFAIDRVREMVEGMKATGIDLLYKEIAGGAHDPRFFLKYDEEVCAFLKAHPRTPYPKTVHWTLDPERKDHDGGYPADTFRWIRIDEAGSTSSNGNFEDAAGSLVRGNLPRVEATYDGNRVDVQTRGVKRYTVLVSDEMLDLSKPVTVTTNGKPSAEVTVEPDAQVILEEARRTKDRKLVFSNRITIEVE